MDSSKKSAWLANEIESAKRSYDRLPDWVKETARFEGTNHPSFGASANFSSKTDGRSKKRKD